MRNDLLKKAREQAEQSEPEVRAAALLRLARAELGEDRSQAKQTLLDGVEAAGNLTGQLREQLLDEARSIAAAVSPELLDAIPIAQREGPEFVASFQSVQIVQTMLTHGHAEAAYNYMMRNHDPESFPILSVGGVLSRFDVHGPELSARRLVLLRHAVEMWRRCPAWDPFHRRNDFVRPFGHFWKEFPPEEALAMARDVVERAAQMPDAGTSSGYTDEVRFTSPRQDMLFQILHVLRHLDPDFAESLLASNDQLAAAARRYPFGMETMNAETKAHAERWRKEHPAGEGGSCGGYFLSGDPKDFDRQRRVIDAARAGDFGPSMNDALDKYREDTSTDEPNYASKIYWPSTGAFRSTLYQAGKRIGGEAANLLEQIPDDNLRLFATIELAAALGGVPSPSVTTMKQPRPPDARWKNARIVSASCSIGGRGALPEGPAMRSPDGRLIRCPKCSFEPSDPVRWICKCGHVWNTFWTAGKCPSCHYQWEVTGCPRCGGTSEHEAWYVADTQESRCGE